MCGLTQPPTTCGYTGSPLRKALDLKPGERLIARKEGESLVLERREVTEKRLWEMFSHIPKDVSLADEIIAERRAEARRDSREE